jgi:hypothetical protein
MDNNAIWNNIPAGYKKPYTQSVQALIKDTIIERSIAGAQEKAETRSKRFPVTQGSTLFCVVHNSILSGT